MTLIEKMLFAAFGHSAQSFSGDMKSATTAMLDDMREWIDKTEPVTRKRLVFRSCVDAYEKERLDA